MGLLDLVDLLHDLHRDTEPLSAWHFVVSRRWLAMGT